MDESLQMSKYLRTIPRGDGIALYHSLTGGLCIVDKNIARFLKRFQRPRSRAKACALAPRLSEGQIQPFIDIFKSKGFLVHPDYDEYAVIRHKVEQVRTRLQRGSQIGVVQLVVTNNCNFKCAYCFINSIYSSEKRFVSQTSPSNRIMSFYTAKSAIEEVIRIIKKNKRDAMGIQFFGGEPLLNWKTIKFVLEQFGRGDRYGIEINYSIVTNGSLITPEMASYFLKYDVPIVISLDSPHRDERLLSTVKSASEGIRKNLEFLKKNGNRVVFNAVFSKETFDFFDTALVDFALDYSIYEIGVLLDLDPAFYKKKKASDIVNRLMEIYTYGKSRGVIVTGYWHMIFQRMIVHDHFKYNRFKTCSATGCQLSIEPSGDVFACKASSGYFGHISKIEDLLSSNTYKGYALRTFRNASECAGCEIESFCSGFCLGPLEKKYKTIHVVEKRTCKVYKEMTRRLILDIERDSIENYRMRGKYQ